LSNVDALDSTTEATIETAIDTLSNLTTTGALGSGSITSGFGNIDIGSSTIGATGTITGPSGTWDSGGMDIASSDSYAIDGTNVLTATALGTAVVSSSLTSVGTLTTLTVDNINLNLNTIASTSGDLQIKAVSGSNLTFQDDADASKECTLVLSGITGSNDRTITMADQNINLTPNTGTYAAAGSIGDVVDDSSPQLGGFLDPNDHFIGMQKGGDISSASPLPIDVDGDYFIVTGTTNFSTMTVVANRHFFLEFAGILTITHAGGTIDIPGAGDYTSVAGDVIECVSTAADVVTIVGMELVSGKAQVESVTLANSVTLTNKTLTSPAVTALTGTIGAVTLGGAVTGGDQEVSAVTFKDVAVKTVVLGASGGGTLTANLNLGQHFTATIDTGSSVITASNFAASDEYMAWVISLTNGESQSITWTNVDWEGGEPPDLTESGLDLLGFYTYDGGTTIHGFPISIASA